MPKPAGLSTSRVIAFAATVAPKRSRRFYEDVLGLRLMADEAPFALVFDANGTMLRLTTVAEMTPAPFTVLGWHVEEIESAVSDLAGRGVSFLRFSGLNNLDAQGIWNAPGGARVAWFNDPDGNVLSITQFPEQ